MNCSRALLLCLIEHAVRSVRSHNRNSPSCRDGGPCHLEKHDLTTTDLPVVGGEGDVTASVLVVSMSLHDATHVYVLAISSHMAATVGHP